MTEKLLTGTLSLNTTNQQFFFVIYHKIDFFYTKNQVYIKNRFGYIKFDFVISQSGGFIIQVSFRTLSVTNFKHQKTKTQIYIFVSFSGFSLESYVR